MSFEPLDLLWLLLPLAAASGWLAARREFLHKHERANRLPQGYFRGVNYLLNEQPDKAIEMFTRMLEINTETVETHLALGSLFRRRGEVERAIRIHQNLMARPTLTQEYRTLALSELAHDYHKAGLLDRAEGLFLELCETREHSEQAMRTLMQIYEQEKDWEKAITIGRRLAHRAGHPTQTLLAQYHCEMAAQQIHAGNLNTAGNTLELALQLDSHCVRARLLSGHLLVSRGALRDAIRVWQAIEQQEPEFMEEAVEGLSEAYQRLGDHQGLEKYLTALLQRHPAPRTLLTLADTLIRRGAVMEARLLVRGHLLHYPFTGGLKWLVEHSALEGEPSASPNDEVASHVLEQLSLTQQAYQCERCGYRGNTLHWQCPACHEWVTTRPAVRAAPERDALIEFKKKPKQKNKSLRPQS